MSDYHCPKCMTRNFNVYDNNLVRFIFRCDECGYEGIYILQHPTDDIINNAVNFMMDDYTVNKQLKDFFRPSAIIPRSESVIGKVLDEIDNNCEIKIPKGGSHDQNSDR